MDITIYLLGLGGVVSLPSIARSHTWSSIGPTPIESLNLLDPSISPPRGTDQARTGRPQGTYGPG